MPHSRRGAGECTAHTPPPRPPADRWQAPCCPRAPAFLPPPLAAARHNAPSLAPGCCRASHHAWQPHEHNRALPAYLQRSRDVHHNSQQHQHQHQLDAPAAPPAQLRAQACAWARAAARAGVGGRWRELWGLEPLSVRLHSTQLSWHGGWRLPCMRPLPRSLPHAHAHTLCFPCMRVRVRTCVSTPRRRDVLLFSWPVTVPSCSCASSITGACCSISACAEARGGVTAPGRGRWAGMGGSVRGGDWGQGVTKHQGRVKRVISAAPRKSTRL